MIFLVLIIVFSPALLALLIKIGELISGHVSEYNYPDYETETTWPSHSYVCHDQWNTNEPYAGSRSMSGNDVRPPVDDVDDDLRKMGWIKEGRYWYGWYTDNHGNKYRGRLSRIYGNNFMAEIKDTDLPDSVRYGKHGGCFLRPYNGWREVHFDKKYDHPKSLVAGVHNCINESYPAYGSVPAFYQTNRGDTIW